MKSRPVDPNLVIIANEFNPSVFSQLWLTKHGLATEQEVSGDDCAFTKIFAQVVASRFVLVVTANHLQLSVRPSVDNQQEFALQKIEKIVELLPHVPFTAVGLNFPYHLKPENSTVEALTRSLFFVSGSPLHRYFGSSDAKFGGYVSKNSLDCRLRLEVRPVIASFDEGSAAEDLVLMAFNYHLDLTKTPGADAIRNCVANWNQARAEAESIANAIGESDI